METTDTTEKFLSTFVVASISAVALTSMFIGSMAMAPALGLWS